MKNKAAPSRYAAAAAEAKRQQDGYLTDAEVLQHGLRPNHARAGDFPPMGEDDELLPLVEALIRRYPVLDWYHTGISVKSRRGWPDLTIYGPAGEPCPCGHVRPNIIVPELKGTRGRVSFKQLHTLTKLRRAGMQADVWWPEDYHLKVIEEAIERLAGIEPASRKPGQSTARRPGYRGCGCHMDTTCSC